MSHLSITIGRVLLGLYFLAPGLLQAMVDRERQNFIKILGILAGLLVLAGTAQARSLSLNGWWQSDSQAV